MKFLSKNQQLLAEFWRLENYAKRHVIAKKANVPLSEFYMYLEMLISRNKLRDMLPHDEKSVGDFGIRIHFIFFNKTIEIIRYNSDDLKSMVDLYYLLDGEMKHVFVAILQNFKNEEGGFTVADNLIYNGPYQGCVTC